MAPSPAGRLAVNKADSEIPRRVLVDGCGFLSQHQKRGLKGILGVLRVAKHAPADREDKSPMPLHERRKGRLHRIVCLHGLKQLAISSDMLFVPGRDGVNILLNDTQSRVRHDAYLLGLASCLIVAARRPLFPLFLERLANLWDSGRETLRV
jgi:hypothetical protein